MTICYLVDIFLFFLKSRSPIALEMFKHPLILPFVSTKPPALRIRCIYYSFYGQWSDVKHTILLFILPTALESPAFAI